MYYGSTQNNNNQRQKRQPNLDAHYKFNIGSPFQRHKVNPHMIKTINLGMDYSKTCYVSLSLSLFFIVHFTF